MKYGHFYRKALLCWTCVAHMRDDTSSQVIVALCVQF